MYGTDTLLYVSYSRKGTIAIIKITSTIDSAVGAGDAMDVAASPSKFFWAKLGKI